MQGRGDAKTFAALVRSKWTERLLHLFLVPILLVYSLWLPPASMGVRLFHTDYSLVTPEEGGIAEGPLGVRLSVGPRAVEKRSRIRIDALAGDALAGVPLVNPSPFLDAAGSRGLVRIKPDSPESVAMQEIPRDLVVYGPFYRFEIYGESSTSGVVSLPIPYELAAHEMADLYVWDGLSWRWLPAHATSNGMMLRAEIDALPSLLMIAQRQSGSPRVCLSVSPQDARRVPKDVDASIINLAGLTLDGEGRVIGQTVDVGGVGVSGREDLLLSISNVIDDVVRSDLVDNLIINEPLREQHVANILGRVRPAVFAGIEIAYQGIDPDLRLEFSAFIAELGRALHDAGKMLAVRVDQPTLVHGAWDTGAYDWKTLGRMVDLVRIPAMPNPAAYVPGGDMDRLLAWATGEVNRRKIDLMMTSYCHDLVGGELVPIDYKEALGHLVTSIEADDADRVLLPGEAVRLTMPGVGEASVNLAQDAQVYWFGYRDAQAQGHTVWLESASSVARKLQYVNRYALGGFSLHDALNEANDEDIVSIVRAFQDNLARFEPRFALVWSIEDEVGAIIHRQIQPLARPQWQWTAPDVPGDYVVRVALSDDGGDTNLGPASQLDLQVPTPTFTPTPTPTNTPTPTSTPTNTPTPEPTSTPMPTPTPKPKPKPAAVKPAGFFGYGIQADLVTDTDHERIYNHIKAIGFNWVKQQVEWFRYNAGPGQYDWGALDRIVEGANAHGINVLFSVVKAPGWSRPPQDTDEGPPADPNTYGAFMRDMAARYKGRVKAYEIWNEQNLYYEWGGRGHKLNAARYVELLKVAYNAIKSVDPGAIVISGALTPTGYNDGDIAIDDGVYLEQMYQAGMARYCDAVGAHPSGYNVPPDAAWQTHVDPSAGFRGPFTNRHPSWFFRGTMERYRNIMIKYGDAHKRIWPTEFGWASVEGLGVPPVHGYEYSADNTEAEQAQFIVRAYQMGKAWGWVGVAFLWNLNFAPVAGKQDEKAAFGIVRDDWSPRPAFAALRDMPK